MTPAGLLDRDVPLAYHGADRKVGYGRSSINNSCEGPPIETMTTPETPRVAITPADLENRFSPAVKDVLGRVLDLWLASYGKMLDPFEKSSRDLAARIGAGSWEKLTLFELWPQLETTFNEYLDWTRSLNVEDDELFSRQFIELWKNEALTIIGEFPASVAMPIEDSFWDAREGDSLRVRAWKWTQRRRYGLRRFLFRVRNSGRKIIRKQPVVPEAPVRSVDLKGFLEHRLVVPAACLLIGEWQRFLQKAAAELYGLHVASESIENDSLFSGEDPESRILPAGEAVARRKEKVGKDIKELLGLFGRIEESKSGAIDRVSKGWDGISAETRETWDVAGTFALPNRRFGRTAVERAWRRIEGDYGKAAAAWGRHYRGEIDEWRKDLELSALQLQTTRVYRETAASVENRIEKGIVPLLESLAGTISSHAKTIREAQPRTKSDLKKIIVTENKALLANLRADHLPVVVDSLAKSEIPSLLQDYPRWIKSVLDALPERHDIFQRRDLESLVPASRIDEVPFRVLVQEEIYPSVAEDHTRLSAEVERISDELFREVSEIDQIVEFNSETALALLDEKKGEEAIGQTHQVINEGLERAGHHVAAIVGKIRKMGSFVSASLLETSDRFLERVQDLENSEKITQLKLRFARAEARKKIRGYGVRAWKNIKVGFAVVRGFIVKIFRRLEKGYLRLRKLSGLTPREHGLEGKLAVFLQRTQDRISALPYIYQRLFRIEPLTDERFFTGRAEDKAELEKSLLNWRAGQYAATALVGEKGSGKTTLLNFAVDQYFRGLPLRKIDLVNTTIRTPERLLTLLKSSFDKPDAGTIDELEEQLSGGEERTVCVLENSQNLFIRTVGGFEAVERLLLFISRTNKAVLWIFTCTLYSWNYLDKVVHISQYFNTTIELGPLTREETESLILKRHRISGYPLHFDLPLPSAQPRKFRKLTSGDDQQAFLKDSFFDQLNRLASGNVAVMMLFWLSAVQKISQDDFVVSPVIDLDFSFLDQLGHDELFTLAALLQHETLNAEEHAAIFHQGIDQSLLLLDRMSNKRYLVHTAERYSIHPLLYRPSVATLKAKNIVH